MRFWLVPVFALVLTVAPSWSANTVEFADIRGTEREALEEGVCVFAEFVDATDETTFLYVGGHTVSIQMDPGSGASAVDVYACTDSDDAGTCAAYQWDSDGDGVVDNSELDGLTAMKRGIQGVQIAGWLYIDPSSISSGATVVVCAQEQGK